MTAHGSIGGVLRHRLPAVVVLGVILIAAPVRARLNEQSKAPSARNSGSLQAQRLLETRDFEYAGAFRLPSTDENGDSFSYGGRPLAFNPARRSLFVGSNSGQIAEVTIPETRKAERVEDLAFARYLHTFTDPTDGHMSEVAPSGTVLAGLLVFDERLLGTGLIFYDANNTQIVSHFMRPLNLAVRGATPMRRVWEPGGAGFVGGYMAAVPEQWQAALGGPAVTGQCCVPIISRTSWGPAAFAWDPRGLANSSALSAKPLLYYSGEHQTLGPWNGSNPTWGGTASVAGMVIPEGTRTALFFGANGSGTFCYGEGTWDKALDGKPVPGGERYCYDPLSPDKGQHAYPYRYQMWAYDLMDLADVAEGKRDPWDVKPYGVWPLDLPFSDGVFPRILSVAYDPSRRLVYLSQFKGDKDGESYRGLIHVFYIT